MGTIEITAYRPDRFRIDAILRPKWRKMKNSVMNTSSDVSTTATGSDDNIAERKESRVFWPVIAPPETDAVTPATRPSIPSAAFSSALRAGRMMLSSVKVAMLTDTVVAWIPSPR